MRITLANNVSAVLGTIAAQMLRMEMLQGKLNKGFSTMGAGFKGVLALAAGGGMLAGLNKLADLGDDVIDQQNQMVRLGIKQNEIARLTADYWKSVAKAVPTSTLVEYLQTVKELRAVVGSTAEAEKFAPAALKFDVLLSNVLGKEMHGSLYQLLRAGEMKGIATQPGQLQDLIQQAYKYIAAFGGKLTPQMIQRLAVRGGTAWMNANLKESFGPMAILAAEMGQSGGGGSSSSPGVVLYQLQQLQLGAHTLSKQQAAVLAHLGILDTTKVQQTGFGGGRYQLLPGAMKGSLQYAGNVPGWAKDVLWPAIVAAATRDAGHGMYKGVTVDQLEQAYLAKIAPTTNKAKAVMLFGDPTFLRQQAKDLGLAQDVLPLDPSYTSFVQQNPKGSGAAVTAQWTTLGQAIGSALTPAKVALQNVVIPFLSAIASAAGMHPEVIKVMGAEIAALATLLAGAGIIALAAAIGPAGWLVIGLTTLAVAIGTFAAINWKGISTAVKGVADDIKTGVLALPSEVSGAISSAFAQIGNEIKNAIMGFGPGRRLQNNSNNLRPCPQRRLASRTATAGRSFCIPH